MAKCDNPLSVGVHEKPLFGNMTAHELLITIATASSIIAISLSFYLVYRHLTNYTQPKLQKLIIRIVLMVPIYTICCTLSIPFYESSIYLGSVYEFYESLVIASFFLLLCRYLHTDLHSVRQLFSIVEPQPWVFPIRIFRKYVLRRKTSNTPNGSKYFNIIWVCILQFCVIKFFAALTKCITEALDVYCKTSNDANHAKIWIQVIEMISLVTAMICLLQFYKQTKLELAVHRPLLKFTAIKLVVFLFYVQSFVFGHLTKKGGAMSPTDSISYPSLAVGIPKTVLCVEMALVSMLHLYAYPYDVFQTYKAVDNSEESGVRDIDSGDDEAMELSSQEDSAIRPGNMHWTRAIIHVLSFKDLWRALRYAYHGVVDHRRSPTAAQHSETHRGQDVRPFVTTSLAEALDVMKRRNNN
ncbi:hypothetical protein ACET3X_005306 [Alternaria dauci]|uniref:DUF300-domain-containing protein n=1 Tax=Alternaria dauci TaxID=48095 RepID=A0ABR3UJW6_9PLEO